MAIGPDQKVTTTGLMGGTPKMPEVPNMAGLGQGQTQQTQGQAPAPIAERPAPKGAQDPNIDERIQNLNETEIAQLDGVLSPSNAAIFKKIAPEASTVIDQFTSEEEVVSLPVSTIVNYAMKIYGGDQQIAVQKFITELSGEQSDNTNVPLDTAQAPTEEGMLAQQPDSSEIDAIDQGLV